MALIECPECKQSISSQAAHCSHCGYQILPPPVPRPGEQTGHARLGHWLDRHRVRDTGRHLHDRPVCGDCRALVHQRPDAIADRGLPEQSPIAGYRQATGCPGSWIQGRGCHSRNGDHQQSAPGYSQSDLSGWRQLYAGHGGRGTSVFRPRHAVGRGPGVIAQLARCGEDWHARAVMSLLREWGA